jgi:hypothetical protein
MNEVLSDPFLWLQGHPPFSDDVKNLALFLPYSHPEFRLWKYQINHDAK